MKGARAVQVRHPASDPLPGDGVRVLVDRRWPPGVPREQVSADLWLREVAPSDELLRSCQGSAARREGFAQLYRRELEKRCDLVQILAQLHSERGLTLLSCGRDGANPAAEMLCRLVEEWCEAHVAAR